MILLFSLLHFPCLPLFCRSLSLGNAETEWLEGWKTILTATSKSAKTKQDPTCTPCTGAVAAVKVAFDEQTPLLLPRPLLHTHVHVSFAIQRFWRQSLTPRLFWCRLLRLHSLRASVVCGRRKRRRGFVFHPLLTLNGFNNPKEEKFRVWVWKPTKEGYVILGANLQDYKRGQRILCYYKLSWEEKESKGIVFNYSNLRILQFTKCLLRIPKKIFYFYADSSETFLFYCGAVFGANS